MRIPGGEDGVDNRATMHRAHGDYDRTQSRVLWRIIGEGGRPRLV
jgi:alpha-ketoglutarate-dependent taurine dioxygenase